MALRSALDFAVKIVGDGSDRVYVLSTATGPLGLSAPPTAAGAAQLSPQLSLATLVPTGIVELHSGNNHAVSASLASGVMTITYAVDDALAADEVDTVTGKFTFPG